VKQVLVRDVLPAIGHHRVAAVKRHEVAQIMERVIGRGSPASANSCLKVIRTIYRWGISTGRCEADVTMGLKKLPSRPRERVLTDHEMRIVWGARTAFRHPYRLSLLTGARIGEVLGADKAEFDLDAGLWTIPSWRTKSRREHQLPLSRQALEVVRQAIEHAGRSRWLFPGLTKTKPLSTKSADAILRLINFNAGISPRFTPHDLRRTCSTRLGDLGVADEIIERILNHAPPTTTRRYYNHSMRLPEMKAGLDAWAEEVERIVAGARP
jgi:integrase